MLHGYRRCGKNELNVTTIKKKCCDEECFLMRNYVYLNMFQGQIPSAYVCFEGEVCLQSIRSKELFHWYIYLEMIQYHASLPVLGTLCLPSVLDINFVGFSVSQSLYVCLSIFLCLCLCLSRYIHVL